MASKVRTLRAVLLGGCAGMAILAAAAPAAATEDGARDYAIAAQDLGEALRAFALTSGHDVVFDPALVRGRTAPAVNGELSDEAALRGLLQGAELAFDRTSSGGFVVRAPRFQASVTQDSEGAVDALIVTAQKREENIQDVPIAISAFSQEDLTRSQVAGGPDLMTQVPNFTFTKTNFSGYSIQIRGIGTQAISATTDPAVAVAFNNTPFIRNRFFEQEFYDLQRLEVLRGPQGTLYGRNATAGVVNIISAKPSFHFEAKASADLANYDSRRLEGMINLPLSADENFALRIAGAWTKREGYVQNLLTGEQTDGRDLWSTRVSLRGQPADWLDINLIWEHFEENDDRLRSGKQLCRADVAPAEINGRPVEQNGGSINFSAGYFNQGCRPTSLYSPDAFETPNGHGLPYYGPLQQLGSPTYLELNPYLSKRQSQDLRAIETHLTPEYEAQSDVLELQVSVDLPGNLSLTSETAFMTDTIFSFQDLNRFDTTPGVFQPGGRFGERFDVVPESGIFCDPQLGCTPRVAAGDLSTAESRHFSQEFRLASNFDGPFNFGLGANFLRYDTEDKYYVFINTLTAFSAMQSVAPWTPGVTDSAECLPRDFYGTVISDTNTFYVLEHCQYIDPNDIHHLNDNGRNYFLSRNPYHLLSYAGFGEAYFNITPDLKLTAGLRWTVDKKEAPQLPSWVLAGGSYGTPTRKVIELDWQEPTGRIAIDWKPDLSFTDDTLVYGSYVRGYKAGGANPPPAILVLSNQVCSVACEGSAQNGQLLQASLTHPETFDAEYVDAFEAGTKNTFLDGAVTANLAAFYYDYRGYQISQIVNRSAVNLNFDAQIWGAELEVDWRPLENLRLGFKGGYEHTRMAEGSQAIDLMDRSAGREGWRVVRPFPTLVSNCVVPEWLITAEPSVFVNLCSAYKTGMDPVTYLPYVPNPTITAAGGPIPEGYPGFDPTLMANANRGEGFLKDLSGNELPNAPDFTATITADYTLPLPNDWLVTLHADFYRQSEAWTRIFNTEGYDKLKAYSNINFAAIFTNEDAGWTVMAYVKNVLDKDNITGAFLFSDDTGLTTNAFLNEPRLYGLRVTKNWTGGTDWWGGLFPRHQDGQPYPLTIEVGGQNQRLDAPQETIMPFAEAFPASLDPRQVYAGVEDGLDSSDRREMRLTYQLEGSPWKFAAGVRYGRTDTGMARFRQEEVGGERVCVARKDHVYIPGIPGVDFGFHGKLQCDPDFGPFTNRFYYNGNLYEFTYQNRYNPDNLVEPMNRSGASGRLYEEHLIADFEVGRDVGLGMLGEGRSSLNAGLRHAEFKSALSGDMRGVPDVNVPEGWGSVDSTFHQYMASFEAEREFKGAGPILSWDASRRVLGKSENGQLNLDWTLTAGALFGKHSTTVTVSEGSSYFVGRYPRIEIRDQFWASLPPAPQTTSTVHRSQSATAPVVDLSLGLSYEVQRFKVGAGYRWERYFDVLDGGFMEHRSYDRTIDGPYFKLSVGFGG